MDERTLDQLEDQASEVLNTVGHDIPVVRAALAVNDTRRELEEALGEFARLTVGEG